MPQQEEETYRGFKIKRYNLVEVRLSNTFFEKIKPALDKGVSLRKIIEMTSAPCDCCKDSLAIGFDKNNNPVQIKRGILKKK